MTAVQIIRFIALGVLLAMIVAAGFRQAVATALASRAFALAEGTQALIIGDSHSACSIDPAIFPRSGNIAEPSENYLYTYYKLRHFLRHNPDIEQVILSFSFHNCARVFGERYLFSPGYTGDSFPKYYMLLDREARRVLRSGTGSYLVSWLKFDLGLPVEISRSSFVVKGGLGLPLRREDFPFSGGFYPSSRSQVTEEDIRQTLDRHYFGEGEEYAGVSPLMIDYLHRIAALCRERGIRLYLFNSPLWPEYRRRLPLAVVEDFERIREGLQREYPEAIYLDYVDFPLEQEYFGDVTHLNARGAERLSRVLAEGMGSEEIRVGEEVSSRNVR